MKKNNSIKNLWTVLVESSSTDRDTNNLSLFNLIEEIGGTVQVLFDKSNEDLILPMKMELVSLWQKIENTNKEVKGNVNIDFVSPSNKVIHNFSYELNIPSNNLRMRTRANLAGIKVEEQGMYKFVIKLSEDSQQFSVVNEVPVVVNVQKQIVSNLNSK